jgi:hypothetical protein
MDADGSFSLVRRPRSWATDPDRTHYLRPITQVGQKKRSVLDYIAECVGAGKINVSKEGVYNLRWNPPTLRWLLPELLPHLVLKRRQAEILIEFMDRCRYKGKKLTDEEIASREALRAEMETLNRKAGKFRPIHSVKAVAI